MNRAIMFALLVACAVLTYLAIGDVQHGRWLDAVCRASIIVVGLSNLRIERRS